MKKYLSIACVSLLVSCTAAKLSVPAAFSSQAEKLPVKGLNGWMMNQRLSFGPYKTSVIKRGWDFTASVSYSRFSLRPEEALLRVFDINTDKATHTQKNKFQYTLENGNGVAEIFATERFQEKQLKYRSNNPWIGDASATNRYEYAFTASILPLSTTDKTPWSLVLVNKYDRKKDTARGLFARPVSEEEGYATNGTEQVTIRPLRVSKLTTKNGKETTVAGGALLSGYEIAWDNGVVGIIDILDNNIWLASNLDVADKLIVSSIASAILLKRMQDVENEKDRIPNT